MQVHKNELQFYSSYCSMAREARVCPSLGAYCTSDRDRYSYAYSMFGFIYCTLVQRNANASILWPPRHTFLSIYILGGIEDRKRAQCVIKCDDYQRNPMQNTIPAIWLGNPYFAEPLLASILIDTLFTYLISCTVIPTSTHCVFSMKTKVEWSGMNVCCANDLLPALHLCPLNIW